MQRIALHVLLLLAGIAIPVAGLGGFYFLLSVEWLTLVFIFVVATSAALTLNINLTGPHRLYRDPHHLCHPYRL